MAGSLAGELLPLLGSRSGERHVDHPLRGELLRVEDGPRVIHRFTGDLGPTQLEPGAALVGKDEVRLEASSGRRRCAFGDAKDRMEVQLSCLADHADSLIRVDYTGEFHDDPPFPGSLKRRLAHSELVNAAPQHLKGAIGGVRVGPAVRGIPGLECDLCSTAQVQAQSHGSEDDDGDGRPDGQKDDQNSTPKMFGHRRTSSSAARRVVPRPISGERERWSAGPADARE